ncbi:hypothetical protein [Heliomarina baculiformis]|uniref:hypothetical protein n=1 Tax=Heliomarina baculiformis TaxID=2872036 RepID=UPI001EE1E314|nr:hypothetical protein [Heliomarina baculiformis]
MSKMLGYSLTLGDFDAWFAFSAVATVRLSETERAALAFAALKSLSPSKAELAADAAISGAGSPSASFFGGMEDARSWANFASRSELKAHALAAYEALPVTDQMAFRRHISEVEIAL